jgi:TetR/AcrR family transcriptional regulator, mexJK operon transcriptional repressor
MRGPGVNEMNDMSETDSREGCCPSLCQGSRRSEKKLKQILDGARAVFREQGFAGASVDDIAKRAGISKATMYRYFPDKSAIYWEVMRGDCQLQAELTQTECGGAPIRDRLLKHARHHLDFVLSPFSQDIFRAAVAESGRMPEFARHFYDSGPDKRKQMLAPILAEASRCGELDIADPEFAAYQFYSLATAEVFFKSLFASRCYSCEEIADYAERAVDTFMRAYAPKGQRGEIR